MQTFAPGQNLAHFVAFYAMLWGMAGLASILRPFRPFRTRLEGLAILVASFVVFALVAGGPKPGEPATASALLAMAAFAATLLWLRRPPPERWAARGWRQRRPEGLASSIPSRRLTPRHVQIPPGQWLAVGPPFSVAGIRYHHDAARAFAEGAFAADKAGGSYGLLARRDLGNSDDPNTISVIGYWSLERNGGVLGREGGHIGYVPRDLARMVAAEAEIMLELRELISEPGHKIDHFIGVWAFLMVPVRVRPAELAMSRSARSPRAAWGFRYPGLAAIAALVLLGAGLSRAPAPQRLTSPGNATNQAQPVMVTGSTRTDARPPVASVPKPPVPSSAVAGQPFAVPTDLGAKYRALEVARTPGGRSIISRREGPSGISFTRRECTCPVARYRILGDGDDLLAAMRDRAPEGWAELVIDRAAGLGSVSYHVCDHACRARL